MQRFTATIRQFADNAEKTGWTYIEIPADIAENLRPGSRTSFRVKGKLDNYSIKGVAVLPMKEGGFILPINGEMRKAIGKRKGAMLSLQLSLDTAPVPMPPGFAECLEDDPEAKSFFESLKLSHRNYFLKWMVAVKGEDSRAKRMGQALNALSRQQDFVTMVRSLKGKKE